MNNEGKMEEHGKNGTVFPAVDSEMSEKASKTLYHLDILKSLRQIVRAVAIHSKKLDQDHNLTVPQLICLLTLAEKGALTVTKISKAIHVSSSTVIGIIDRLEEKGLVRRTRSKDDRRLVDVSVTEKGLAAAKEAPPPLQDVLASSVQGLPELEQAAISLSLKRIVDLLQEKKVIVSPQPSPMLELDTNETNNK